jgi:hypothetical protein
MGMQKLAFQSEFFGESGVVLRPSVFLVAHQGMSDRKHVRPDLVGSSAAKNDLQK